MHLHGGGQKFTPEVVQDLSLRYRSRSVAEDAQLRELGQLATKMSRRNGGNGLIHVQSGIRAASRHICNVLVVGDGHALDSDVIAVRPGDEQRQLALRGGVNTCQILAACQDVLGVEKGAQLEHTSRISQCKMEVSDWASAAGARVRDEWGITDIVDGSVKMSPQIRSSRHKVLHCKPPVGYTAKAASNYLKTHSLATTSREFMKSCRFIFASSVQPRPDVKAIIHRCVVAQQCVHIGPGMLKWRFRENLHKLYRALHKHAHFGKVKVANACVGSAKMVLLLKWTAARAIAVSADITGDESVAVDGHPRALEQYLQVTVQYLDCSMQSAMHYLERDESGDRADCIGMRPVRFCPNGGQGCYPRTWFEIIDEVQLPLEAPTKITVDFYLLYGAKGDRFY